MGFHPYLVMDLIIASPTIVIWKICHVCVREEILNKGWGVRGTDEVGVAPHIPTNTHIGHFVLVETRFCFCFLYNKLLGKLH